LHLKCLNYHKVTVIVFNNFCCDMFMLYCICQSNNFCFDMFILYYICQSNSFFCNMFILYYICQSNTFCCNMFILYCISDDELVESVKCMKEISFCHSQHSTITTLTLAKYKLCQSNSFYCNMFILYCICQSKGVCCNNADDVLSHFGTFFLSLIINQLLVEYFSEFPLKFFDCFCYYIL
jgi:hypothetical protein